MSMNKFIMEVSHTRTIIIWMDHHPSLSCEANHHTLHFPQVQGSSLEETLDELAKARAKMENSQAQMAKSS